MRELAKSTFPGGVSRKVWSRGSQLLLTGLVFSMLAGCGGTEGGVEGEDRVRLLEVDSPLKSPVWGAERQAVFALQQDEGRLVKAEVTNGGSALGESGDGGALPVPVFTAGLDRGIGENLAADLSGEGALYVPQPEEDQVVIVGKEDLLTVRTYDVGPAPERVAVDARSGVRAGDNVLFALGANHSAITGTNLESGEIVFQEDVEASDDTLMEAAKTGANAELWTAGPEGVSYYSVGGLRRPVELDRGATALAVRPGDATRAFTGDATGEVEAVHATSALALETGERADVGERVEVLAAEEDRLYAATPGRLVTLDADSLEQTAAVEFADSQEDLDNAVPSGIAVGEQSVYVTLENQPYMLEVEKS